MATVTVAPLTPMPRGCRLTVRVIARARHNSIDGVRGGALVVRLAAPPVEGAANAALIALLADTLELGRSALRLVSGAHHRLKVIDIAGCGVAEASSRLGMDGA